MCHTFNARVASKKSYTPRTNNKSHHHTHLISLTLTFTPNQCALPDPSLPTPPLSHTQPTSYAALESYVASKLPEIAAAQDAARGGGGRGGAKGTV